ncbi:MAG TPA: HAMP domain-containing sensor histidine kinase [Spirochaetia bacterium]|nr:HAMP domain-containing sensor histidine kinase [Spirochaetia bacterium]
MKLRTQFVLLVAGIIVVPLLVGALVVMLQYLSSRGREPVPNYPTIMSWLRREVPRAMKHHDLRELAENRPPGLDLVVLDAENTISFSTIPELPTGTPAARGELFAYMRRNVDSFHFAIETPRDPGQSESLVILKLPKVRPDIASFRSQLLLVVTYSMATLLLFSSLMSALILRSLNRSILKLEGATRRIAEGDLDFELPARGNDQIASLTRSFDSMRRALKEEYARRSRFIMGVSHDLRTPLTLIQGYVEAITDGFAAEPESQKRYLSIILDKTHALEAMIGELIEFVKMETGEWRMTHREVPFRSFLEERVRLFGEDALILRREFTSSVDIPDTVSVRMDPGLFARALENLVGNAIRYTAEGGKIHLGAAEEGNGVVLSISDTGIGIPREDLGKIFDPFYRGTNSRREQGFGLGLTTVRSIIESHGWSIAVSSDLGMGTTFTIRMPVVEHGTNGGQSAPASKAAAREGASE